MTTDFRDLTDVNHERKRDNPFNLCNLCSKKDKGKRMYLIYLKLISSQSSGATRILV